MDSQSSGLGSECSPTPKVSGFDIRMTSEEMLSHACDWTLACDTAVLNRLKDYSQNMLKRAESIKENCNSCVNQVELLQTQVQSMTNQFLILANDQFVENCVEEFEETCTTDETKSPFVRPVKTKAEKEAELIMKMKESIHIGIETSSLCDKSGSRIPKVKTAHIIGTPKFFSSRYCGLVDESSRQRIETESTDQNLICSSAYEDRAFPVEGITDAMDIPNTKRKAPSSVDSDYQYGHGQSKPSKSESSEENNFLGFTKTPLTSSTNSLSTTHSHDTDLKKPQYMPTAKPPISIMDDLNKVLRSRVPPPPRDSDSEDDFKPEAGNVSDLFADVEESVDIFGTNSSKSVAEHHVENSQKDLFRPAQTINSIADIIKSQAICPPNQNSFQPERIQNELFKPTQAINSMADIIKSQPISSKQSQNQRQSVFADSDSDNDIFSATSSTSSSSKSNTKSKTQRQTSGGNLLSHPGDVPSPKATLPSPEKRIPSSQILTQEGEPKGNDSQQRAQIATTFKADTPSPVSQAHNPINSKGTEKRSIFEDSESDDDLFSTEASSLLSKKSIPPISNIFGGDKSSKLFGADQDNQDIFARSSGSIARNSLHQNVIITNKEQKADSQITNEASREVKATQFQTSSLFAGSGLDDLLPSLSVSATSSRSGRVRPEVPANGPSSMPELKRDSQVGEDDHQKVAQEASESLVYRKPQPQENIDRSGVHESEAAAEAKNHVVDTSSSLNPKAARSILSKTLTFHTPETISRRKITSPTSHSTTESTLSEENIPSNTSTPIEEHPASFDNPPQPVEILTSLAKSRPKIRQARRRPTRKSFQTEDDSKFSLFGNGYLEPGLDDKEDLEPTLKHKQITSNNVTEQLPSNSKIAFPSPVTRQEEPSHIGSSGVFESQDSFERISSTDKAVHIANSKDKDSHHAANGTYSSSVVNGNLPAPEENTTREASTSGVTAAKRHSRSVFEDSDSDSDIFASANSRSSGKSTLASSSLNSLLVPDSSKKLSNEGNTNIAKKVETKSRPKSIFENSDSDDGDWFSSNKTIRAVSVKSKNVPSDNQNVSSITNGPTLFEERVTTAIDKVDLKNDAKSTQVKSKPQAKSIFDDSDSDSDIFKPKSKLF